MAPTFIDLTDVASSPPRAPEKPTQPAGPLQTPEFTMDALLQEAISTATLVTLQATLKEMCKRHPEAARTASDLLLVPETEVRYLSAEESCEEEEEEEEDEEEKDDEGDDEGDDDGDGGEGSEASGENKVLALGNRKAIN